MKDSKQKPTPPSLDLSKAVLKPVDTLKKYIPEKRVFEDTLVSQKSLPAESENIVIDLNSNGSRHSRDPSFLTGLECGIEPEGTEIPIKMHELYTALDVARHEAACERKKNEEMTAENFKFEQVLRTAFAEEQAKVEKLQKENEELARALRENHNTDASTQNGEMARMNLRLEELTIELEYQKAERKKERHQIRLLKEQIAFLQKDIMGFQANLFSEIVGDFYSPLEDSKNLSDLLKEGEWHAEMDIASRDDERTENYSAEVKNKTAIPLSFPTTVRKHNNATSNDGSRLRALKQSTGSKISIQKNTRQSSSMKESNSSKALISSTAIERPSRQNKGGTISSNNTTKSLSTAKPNKRTNKQSRMQANFETLEDATSDLRRDVKDLIIQLENMNHTIEKYEPS